MGGAEGELEASCNIVSVRSWRGVRARGVLLWIAASSRCPQRRSWQDCKLGLSPYLDERVQYRTSPRGLALRAKSARRQCCMTPPAPPPPPASRAPLPRPPSPEPIEVTSK